MLKHIVRSPRRAREMAVATARVSRNLCGAFELAEIRASRQARRHRNIFSSAAGVNACGDASAKALPSDLRPVLRTDSNSSDCSRFSMDSGASDATCLGETAAAAVATNSQPQPCSLAAAMAAGGRRFAPARAAHSLVATVAGTLAALHAEAVVHCSVGPDAIALDPQHWSSARQDCASFVLSCI